MDSRMVWGGIGAYRGTWDRVIGLLIGSMGYRVSFGGGSGGCGYR